MFLRDIIDLEATYAGPDAKAMRRRRSVPDGKPLPGVPGMPSSASRAAGSIAAVRARRSATPFKVGAAPRGAEAEEKDPAELAAEADMEDDEFENSMSLAAIEAELKPKVLETFDNVANEYKRLRKLQEQDIELRLKSRFALALAGAQIQEAEGRDHHRGEVAAPQSGAHRFTGRSALRDQQAPRRSSKAA